MRPSENRDPKESNRTDATGVHFQRKVLFFFFDLPPKCESNIRIKGGFCAPKQECAPKAKIVPPKKATELTPLRCICDKDLLFGLHP